MTAIADPALRALAAVVGEAWADASPDGLRAASTATFATRQRVAAVVRPGSREEVRACVLAASRHGAMLQPVSRGCNWGYGSRVPATDGAVLLALDRLDRITGFDERLGWVALEPGVTFRQLACFLRGRGSRLHLPPPGSTADASVVGNALERGIAQGPHADRSARVCALEVVLADGATVRTGAAGLPGSRAANVHPWGLGPSLDGLFIQSAMGIVTEMTVWLDPLPEAHRHFHFALERDEELDAAIDGLQRLAMEGTVSTSISLHNDYKVLALAAGYPYALAAGRTPLPEALRRERIAALGGGRWFGEAAVHGATAAVVEALHDRVEQVLGAAAALRWSAPDAPGACFGGGEGGEALRQAYWRKPTPPPPDPDPDRDRCGVAWHSPVAPFEPAALRACIAIATRVLAEAGFEPALSLQAVSPRAVYAIVSILFDRDLPGEDARALACHRRLAGELAAEGFHPYRASLLDAGGPSRPDGDTAALLGTLRRALDPGGVLARGRYDFGTSG